MFDSNNILLSNYDDISNMEKRKKVTTVIVLLAAAIMLSSTLTSTNLIDIYAQEVKTLRIGYFPNINHAQAVIGLGNGDFQRVLGNNVKVETCDI